MLKPSRLTQLIISLTSLLLPRLYDLSSNASWLKIRTKPGSVPLLWYSKGASGSWCLSVNCSDSASKLLTTIKKVKLIIAPSCTYSGWFSRYALFRKLVSAKFFFQGWRGPLLGAPTSRKRLSRLFALSLGCAKISSKLCGTICNNKDILH